MVRGGAGHKFVHPYKISVLVGTELSAIFMADNTSSVKVGARVVFNQQIKFIQYVIPCFLGD